MEPALSRVALPARRADVTGWHYQSRWRGIHSSSRGFGPSAGGAVLTGTFPVSFSARSTAAFASTIAPSPFLPAPALGFACLGTGGGAGLGGFGLLLGNGGGLGRALR